MAMSTGRTLDEMGRSDVVVRRARLADVAELVRLRGLMFDAMGLVGGSPEWPAAAIDVMTASLDGGRMAGFVVDDPDVEGRLAAGGVVEYEPRLPSPANPTGVLAYVSNIATDPGWRRRGFARAVTEALLDDARRRRVARIELHATPEGIDLYRSLGFVDRAGNPEMRWAGLGATSSDGRASSA